MTDVQVYVGHLRRRSTSTAWCATTSCARARTSPTSRSTWWARTTASRRATRIAKQRARRCWRRSRRATAPTSRSPRCRPGRRCSRPWWPRSTAPTWSGSVELAAQVQRDLREHAGHRRRRLVRRGSAAQARVRGRPREGGARRRHPRDDRRGRCASPLAGAEVGLLHDRERARAGADRAAPRPRAARRASTELLGVAVHGAGRAAGAARRAGATSARRRASAFIYHKNLRPGDLRHRRGGRRRRRAPVYGILDMRTADHGARGSRRAYAIEVAVRRTCPRTTTRYALKWDGEWQITYEVFRDMGIAFAVVHACWSTCWWWPGSARFVTPLIIMAPIPLTLIGILPGALARPGCSSPPPR